jgi:hypothetical protein
MKFNKQIRADFGGDSWMFLSPWQREGYGGKIFAEQSKVACLMRSSAYFEVAKHLL